MRGLVIRLRCKQPYWHWDDLQSLQLDHRNERHFNAVRQYLQEGVQRQERLCEPVKLAYCQLYVKLELFDDLVLCERRCNHVVRSSYVELDEIDVYDVVKLGCVKL